MMSSPAGVSSTLSTGAGPFHEGSMFVSEESLFFTEENIEEIPSRSPWMMLTPAFHSHDAAPENTFLMLVGILRTVFSMLFTQLETVLTIPLHMEDVMLVTYDQPLLMRLRTQLMALETVEVIEFHTPLMVFHTECQAVEASDMIWLPKMPNWPLMMFQIPSPMVLMPFQAPDQSPLMTARTVSMMPLITWIAPVTVDMIPFHDAITRGMSHCMT